MLQNNLHKLCKWQIQTILRSMPTRSNFCDIEKNGNKICDDLQIIWWFKCWRAQVRDQGILVSNTATFTLHITAASSGIHGRQKTYIQAIDAIQRTFTYKIAELRHLNNGKTARTKIILSPKTPWTLYNYIYLEDNIAYDFTYWFHNGAQNRN